MDYKAAKLFILRKMESELTSKLTYHGVHHTLDVLKITSELCEEENISKRETKLLKTAALFHDCGFTETYTNHEEKGCEIAKKSLPQFCYNKDDVEIICGMIMATKIPQAPKSLLEKIICDADLDYLGRNDFYKIGNTLFEEFKEYKVILDKESWNRLQVGFIGGHNYFTETTLARRESKKQEYLQELKELVASYKD
ncbi:HD domain-containing protein [bacterium]|nr:HD domain-containing protein [Saprospiraceae bacterium]MDC3253332.1 HD domain-containing protein [bacterium]